MYCCAAAVYLVRMKIKDTKFVPCDFGNGHTYRKIIKKILSHADEVVFTVHPFLDDDDEFKNGRWSNLSDSFLYSVYDHAPTDQPNDKSSMIILKNDYYVYDYFLNLCDLYEIQEDDTYGISIEDPAFMKNGEIFCYSISHEEGCDIEEALWEQIRL